MKNLYIAKKFWNRNNNRNMTQWADIKSKYPNLIDFGLGDPDLTTHKRITQKAFVDALSGHTHYSEDLGYMDLREEIGSYYKEEHNHDVAIDEIMVTTGSSHGMWLTLTSILDPGDEVIIPTPHYTTYEGQVELTGGKPVFLPTYEDENFSIDVERLEGLITNRTKAIILNSPNNPTGVIIDRNTLEKIGNICERHDLLIIADEVYTIYNYGQEFVPISSLDNLKRRTITLGSFSKDFAMAGWRIGYVLAEDYLIDLFKHINEFNVYAAPSISQRAALHALKLRKPIQEELRQEFKRRLFYGYDRLKNMKNIRINEPQGAFFLFPNIEETGLNSDQVAKILLEEAQILVLSGSMFGKAGNGFLRLSCSADMDKMREGFNRMERLSIFR